MPQLLNNIPEGRGNQLEDPRHRATRYGNNKPTPRTRCGRGPRTTKGRHQRRPRRGQGETSEALEDRRVRIRAQQPTGGSPYLPGSPRRPIKQQAQPRTPTAQHVALAAGGRVPQTPTHRIHNGQASPHYQTRNHHGLPVKKRNHGKTPQKQG